MPAHTHLRSQWLRPLPAHGNAHWRLLTRPGQSMLGTVVDVVLCCVAGTKCLVVGMEPAARQVVTRSYKLNSSGCWLSNTWYCPYCTVLCCTAGRPECACACIAPPVSLSLPLEISDVPPSSNRFMRLAWQVWIQTSLHSAADKSEGWLFLGFS